MTETVRNALALLNPQLRRRWLLLIPWAVMSAALEMVATTGMLVLIRVVSDPGTAAQAGTFLRRIEKFGFGRGAALNAAFAAGLALFYVAKNGLRLRETYAQQRCATDTAVWISSGLLKRYLEAPYSLHLRRNSSEMLHNVGAAADQVSWVVLQSAVALVSELMVVLGILAVLFIQLPSSALGAAALIAALTMYLLWLTQHRHTRWSHMLHDAGIRQFQNMRQSMAAVKEAKILGREAYFVQRFAVLRAAVGDVDAVRQTLEVVPRLVVETVFVLALAAMIFVIWLRGGSAADLIPTLGIFAYGGLRLLPSLHLIVYRFNRVGSGVAAVNAVSRDWHELEGERPSAAGAAFTEDPNGRIVFESVSFSYESTPDPALRDVGLAIRRGESFGIVGPTGAGKTTLVDLMLGLLEPTSGRITVDGRDIREALPQWQRQLGYVPQNVYLIDDTIRRNIALGVDDRDIDDGRVMEAARVAQLQDFLSGLPDGVGTRVGERGVKLSGGERQRIAVARALYRRPCVLVFDEATSALDNATEQALTNTIGALRGQKTIIFVAHRLTTVQSCDQIVFLANGRVAGIGTYAELLGRNADFQKLVSAAPRAAAVYVPEGQAT